MTETMPGAEVQAGDAAVQAAKEAARERQSYVRHELRAPLAVIYPLLSLLRDGGAGELTPRQEEYLEVLERNVTRMETLVSGTVASGWADCSAAPPVPETVVLGDVAEELATLRRMEGLEGAAILLDAGAAPTPRAWADRDDVRQILADLVGNAVAYTPAAGTVTIRARRDDDDTVVLEVEDTGPGVPPEELGRVFDFGFRGELARSMKVPGLGAGLWICRRLAERNGGSLAVASEPGTGVVATLTLPASEDGPP
jgi:signal transduction histidine kinase